MNCTETKSEAEMFWVQYTAGLFASALSLLHHRVGPSHLLWVWGAGCCSTRWPRWWSPPSAAAEPDGSVTFDPRPHQSYERRLCACSATWAFYREEEWKKNRFAVWKMKPQQADMLNNKLSEEKWHETHQSIVRNKSTELWKQKTKPDSYNEPRRQYLKQHHVGFLP